VHGRITSMGVMEDGHVFQETAFLRRRGNLMRKSEHAVSWVVYRMTVRGKTSGMGTVCEQGEWDLLESAQPGFHKLVRAGITNEGEAERLARSIPVDLTPTKPAEAKAT